mmetsp:Transcript_39682/g.114159  ORF Transcript_39682/g.114159 Transcript_39682/m.114159 type:complete len:274 (-) Transcript_39682:131-952(-)
MCRQRAWLRDPARPRLGVAPVPCRRRRSHFSERPRCQVPAPPQRQLPPPRLGPGCRLDLPERFGAEVRTGRRGPGGRLPLVVVIIVGAVGTDAEAGARPGPVHAHRDADLADGPRLLPAPGCGSRLLADSDAVGVRRYIVRPWRCACRRGAHAPAVVPRFPPYLRRVAGGKHTASECIARAPFVAVEAWRRLPCRRGGPWHGVVLRLVRRPRGAGRQRQRAPQSRRPSLQADRAASGHGARRRSGGSHPPAVETGVPRAGLRHVQSELLPLRG